MDEIQKKSSAIKIIQITTHQIPEIDYENNWTDRGRFYVLGLGSDSKVYFLDDGEWFIFNGK